jgi:hypothetical protein
LQLLSTSQPKETKPLPKLNACVSAYEEVRRIVNGQ